MSSGPSPHRWDIAKYSRHRPDAGGPSPNAWQYVADKDIRLLFTEPNPLFPAVPSLRVVVHQGPKPITLESLVIIPSLSLNLQVSEDGLVFQYLCEQRTRKFQLRFVESGSVARVLAVLSKYITVPVDLPLDSHATSQSISASPQGPLTQTSDSGSTVLLPATDSGTVCDVGSAKRALMSLSDEQIISLVQSIRQDPAFKFVRERVKRLCRSIQ
ncbi:uncharacterized protein BJ171DRAFT_577955 [Polychytrium aggregatum]|uniref:uncharacterized protein n=1 Tax=Polychytrium aggregatum TaxID=110093 RepID=UPI0022FE4239|nr:uncharacterized protein BJ171DRAFT_577955 [Polychytrium aggregatum]KAI9208137.1 hypothetical protein BJ171DRAFT_577955 [Polychytrium aggregatum]